MGDFVPTRSAKAPHEAEVAAATPMHLTDRIIREPECHEISGLSRSTRWRLERAGEFPRRRRISAGCTGWLASEMAAWVADRAERGPRSGIAVTP
jgi:prophage regulatory protein